MESPFHAALHSPPSFDPCAVPCSQHLSHNSSMDGGWWSIRSLCSPSCRCCRSRRGPAAVSAPAQDPLGVTCWSCGGQGAGREWGDMCGTSAKIRVLHLGFWPASMLWGAAASWVMGGWGSPEVSCSCRCLSVPLPVLCLVYTPLPKSRDEQSRSQP